MTRILVADEHALYRTGLRVVIDAALSDVDFLEADNLSGLQEILMDPEPIDLALISLSLIGPNDPYVIRELKRISPSTRYIVISAVDGTFDQILRYIAEGFRGFISKAQRDEEIADAIRKVLSGRLAVPRALMSATARGESQYPPLNASELKQIWQQNPFGLTPRQRDVLSLLADGLSNREIAQALHIAEPTTKIHVSALMKVLNVRNRTEAAVLARNIFRAIEQDANEN